MLLTLLGLLRGGMFVTGQHSCVLPLSTAVQGRGGSWRFRGRHLQPRYETVLLLWSRVGKADKAGVVGVSVEENELVLQDDVGKKRSFEFDALYLPDSKQGTAARGFWRSLWCPSSRSAR